MKRRKKPIVPPADIILDLINDEPYVEMKLLNYYEAYILSAAKEPKYTANGEFVGLEINEDLAQELRVSVYRSLPKLRQAFFRKFGNQSIIVMVSKQQME